MNETTARTPANRALTAAAGWALMLALVAPLACSGAVAPPAENASATTGDLIALLPADVTTIAYVDFAAVRQSPLYDFARREGGAFADPQALEEVLEHTGIDAAADLHRFALAIRDVAGEAEAGAHGNNLGLVLSVTYDHDRVADKLAALPSHEYNGTSVYELANWRAERGAEGEQAEPHEHGEQAPEGQTDKSDSTHAYLALLDDSTVVLGGEEMVHGVLDVAAGAPSARANETLMGLIEDVDAGSEIWSVSTDNPLAEAAARRGASTPQIPIDRIRELISSIELGEGFRFELRGRTDSEDDAKLLGDSLNGMLAFGKMMLQSRSPEVFAILDKNVRAGSSGRDVTVRADLTMEQIEQLYRFARSTLDSSHEQQGGGA